VADRVKDRVRQGDRERQARAGEGVSRAMAGATAGATPSLLKPRLAHARSEPLPFVTGAFPSSHPRLG
jgi:hypothetical protein